MNLDEDVTREQNLAALFQENPPSPEVVDVLIPLSSITVIANPRTKYDKAELDSLADSIERHGQIQSVVVRHGGQEGAYDLIAGTRRYRAFLILAERHPGDERWTKIRASVQDHHTGPRLKAVQTIENIKRSDLSVLELADAVSSLKEDGLSSDEVATELGYSKRHVDRLSSISVSPVWLRKLGDVVEAKVPVMDEDGNRELDEEGNPQFQLKRLPGFAYRDLYELISFHRQLDAWDRKQQDINTVHRPKAENETLRIARKAALHGVTGERLRAQLKAKLAEYTGEFPKAKNKAVPAKRPYEITETKVVIDVDAITEPLSANDLALAKPRLVQALQKLGFTTIRLS